MRHSQYTVNIGEFLDIGEGMLCCCYSTDLDVRKENCWSKQQQQQKESNSVSQLEEILRNIKKAQVKNSLF